VIVSIGDLRFFGTAASGNLGTIDTSA